MNPSTRLLARRGPYALASRLDVKTTNGGGPSTGQRPCDLEALDVGQADVEQDEIRQEGPRSRQARGAVGRLADDVEAVGLEQGPRLEPEARVVIDDEDRVHERHRGIGPVAGCPTGSPLMPGMPCAGIRLSAVRR